MSMLPRLKPKDFYDLVIEIAIVRPGPIQGNMVHPTCGGGTVSSRWSIPSKDVENVLKRTLGVRFPGAGQQLAVVAAGFTPGKADQLRRSMASWRRNGDIERFREPLIKRNAGTTLHSGIRRAHLQPDSRFGEYGFPESHSASFALIAYSSAWIKRYHPAAFLAALLNSQPMGFYTPSQTRAGCAPPRRRGAPGGCAVK